MADTFRDLIEADLGSLMSAAGEAVADKVAAKAKEMGNRALSGVSARATGRLDLGLVYQDLLKNWKYFLTTQQMKPTVAAFVDFCQTVFGMPLPEESVYTAIYGFDPLKSPKPPKIMAPNKAVLDGLFKVIFSRKASQPRLLTASQDLVRYAENNDADENYIVVMLKWLGAKAPDMLKRDGMEPLSSYNHGGNLDKQVTEKLLKGLASIIIKQQYKKMRDGGEEPKAAQAGAQQGAPETPDDTKAENGGQIDNAGKVSSTANQISLDPPALQQEGAWGGLKLPEQKKAPTPEGKVKNNIEMCGIRGIRWADNVANANNNPYWEKVLDYFVTLPAKQVNAVSAQLMSIIAHLPSPPQNFVSAVTEVQEKHGTMVWPKKNFIAAYNFARYGGPFDEITAELQHFCNNSQKAALIITTLLRFIAKEEATRGGGRPDGSISLNNPGDSITMSPGQRASQGDVRPGGGE